MPIVSIQLPKNIKLQVEPGHDVDFNTPLAKTKKIDTTVTVEVTQILGVAPKDIFSYIQKFVGETIAKDELLASKKTMLSSIELLSEYDGIVKEIDHINGHVVLETESQDEANKDTNTSFFKGTIDSIDNRTISLKVKKKAEVHIQSKSDTTLGGKVFYIHSVPEEQRTIDQFEQAIVISHEILPFEQRKAEALGAIGFITSKPLSEDTTVPKLLVKSASVMDEVLEHRLPYLVSIENTDTIILYA